MRGIQKKKQKKQKKKRVHAEGAEKR